MVSRAPVNLVFLARLATFAGSMLLVYRVSGIFFPCPGGTAPGPTIWRSKAQIVWFAVFQITHNFLMGTYLLSKYYNLLESTKGRSLATQFTCLIWLFVPHAVGILLAFALEDKRYCVCGNDTWLLLPSGCAESTLRVAPVDTLFDVGVDKFRVRVPVFAAFMAADGLCILYNWITITYQHAVATRMKGIASGEIDPAAKDGDGKGESGGGDDDDGGGGGGGAKGGAGGADDGGEEEGGDEEEGGGGRRVGARIRGRIGGRIGAYYVLHPSANPKRQKIV